MFFKQTELCKDKKFHSLFFENTQHHDAEFYVHKGKKFMKLPSGINISEVILDILQINAFKLY